MTAGKYLSLGGGSLSSMRLRVARNSTDKLFVIGDNVYATGTSSTAGYGLDADSTGHLNHDMKVGDASDELRYRVGNNSELGDARYWLRVNGNGKLLFGNDSATSINISGTGPLMVVGNTSRVFTEIRTPSSSSESCNRGEQTFDLNFVYICDTNNQWKRIATSSF